MPSVSEPEQSSIHEMLAPAAAAIAASLINSRGESGLRSACARFSRKVMAMLPELWSVAILGFGLPRWALSVGLPFRRSCCCWIISIATAGIASCATINVRAKVVIFFDNAHIIIVPLVDGERRFTLRLVRVRHQATTSL